MHLRSGLALALIAPASCTTPKVEHVTNRAERIGPCQPNTGCELAGLLVLQAEPGSYNTASIDQVHGTCVPLLVPASLQAGRHRWQGKRVRLTGTALARVAAPGVVRIQYRDRWLSEGICGNSEIVVYVDQIRREQN